MPPIQPDCEYANDPNFPLHCDFDYNTAYCCLESEGAFVNCHEGECVVQPQGCTMSFPFSNSSGQPMLKTALNGTIMSAWVKIAFQQYCGPTEYAPTTAETILTMGNLSQPCNQEKCKAVIKAFQYGWGTVNQGNRCRITILDQKGSTFQQWVERMGINPEGDTAPVQGKYRMKVQWGWYGTGGAESDVCGQPPQSLGDIICSDTEASDTPQLPPAEGFNSAFIICSPVLWFITDWINVHYENGKFIYELEGVDQLVRGQENMINKVLGRSGGQMYFTKACEILGKISFPPFRVAFKAIDANGDVVDMQFVKPDGDVQCREDIDEQLGDCLGWGNHQIWMPNTKPPLAIIQDWINGQNVAAKDLTGKITSNKGRVGITMNFDPTYKYKKGDDPCITDCGDSTQPQYGQLILWANGIPYCQGNFNNTEINNRLKAVYVVNGGNCSPVLHFAPSFRWHSMAARGKGGVMGPTVGTVIDKSQGAVKTNCQIASSPGPNRHFRPAPGQQAVKTTAPGTMAEETTYHQVMANLAIGAIEADLRVQGDPSDWLCSPILGYGRCVGIIFINPFFLVDNKLDDGSCPIWAANDPDSKDFKSICNELLTSKGWFIMGVEHQIKDGQYVTTLKLKLIAPGAELNPAGSIVNLGGDSSATPLPYGGLSGCLTGYLVGNLGTSWGEVTNCPATYTGGGTPCDANYIIDPTPPPD